MFYYYGAKHRAAKHYPPPLYELIVEPFAGAAGYAMFHLDRDPRTKALLIEKDPRVADLWVRLLSSDPFELSRYPAPAVGSYTTDFFVMCAAASNALARAERFKVTERSRRAFLGMRKRVARLVGKVRGRVEICRGDYSSAPDLTATWFVDPPYAPPSSGGPRGRGGDGYGYGCRSRDIRYRDLATFCQTRKGQVIVCEYATATWLPFRPLYEHLHSQGRSYKEGLWVKGSQNKGGSL